jgi:hypothetical protein
MFYCIKFFIFIYSFILFGQINLYGQCDPLIRYEVRDRDIAFHYIDNCPCGSCGEFIFPNGEVAPNYSNLNNPALCGSLSVVLQECYSGNVILYRYDCGGIQYKTLYIPELPLCIHRCTTIIRDTVRYVDTVWKREPIQIIPSKEGLCGLSVQLFDDNRTVARLYGRNEGSFDKAKGYYYVGSSNYYLSETCAVQMDLSPIYYYGRYGYHHEYECSQTDYNQEQFQFSTSLTLNDRAVNILRNCTSDVRNFPIAELKLKRYNNALGIVNNAGSLHFVLNGRGNGIRCNYYDNQDNWMRAFDLEDTHNGEYRIKLQYLGLYGNLNKFLVSVNDMELTHIYDPVNHISDVSEYFVEYGSNMQTSEYWNSMFNYRVLRKTCE